MAPFTRRLRKIEEPRMAAAGAAIPVLAILGAYGYALTISPALAPPTRGGIAAAAGLVGIAGTGLLYAWRAVTGASDE